MNYRIDLTYLTEITAGDNDVMAEMIELFLAETPKQIELLKEYHEKEDWPQVGAEAHKLKPTFLYVGLSELNELTLQLEQRAKNKEGLGDIEGFIKKIEEGYKSVVNDLEEVLNRLRK